MLQFFKSQLGYVYKVHLYHLRGKMRQHTKNGESLDPMSFPRDHHIHFAKPCFHEVFERVPFLPQFCLYYAHNEVLLLDYNHAIYVGQELLVEDIRTRQLLKGPLLYQVNAALHYQGFLLLKGLINHVGR